MHESILADYIPNVKCIWSTRKSMTKYDKETDTMTITEFDEEHIISNLAEYEKRGKIKPVSWNNINKTYWFTLIGLFSILWI